jgi:hypothetical protein
MKTFNIMHYTGRSGMKIDEVEAVDAATALRLGCPVSGTVVSHGETAALYISDEPLDPQHSEWYESVPQN